MGAKETEEYIQKHKMLVKKRVDTLCRLLEERAQTHDDSKLARGEFEWWVAMDEEPRYPYGSEEYKQKIKRWSWLLGEHYTKNSHHPEFYLNDLSEMDLLDLIEMLCDWISYNEAIDKIDAYSSIERQLKRFKFPKYLSKILENTITRYLAVDKTVEGCRPTSYIISVFEEGDREEFEKAKLVRQYMEDAKKLIEEDEFQVKLERGRDRELHEGYVWVDSDDPSEMQLEDLPDEEDDELDEFPHIDILA